MTDSQNTSVLRNKGKRHIWRAFQNHEMHGEQTFENDGPCRVSQPVLQRAKHLADAGITRVSCDEEVLDVFRLGRRIL